MRIIGGYFKGKALRTKISRTVRPTSDFVREAIFDTLANYTDILNCTVLDLFSGSGLLGIEALSRGASFCQFVDKSKASIQIIKEFLLELSIDKNKYRVTNSDVFSFLNTYQSEKHFDLVFSDPPYKSNLNKKLLENPNIDKIAKKGTIFVVETYSKSNINELEKFDLLQKKLYGETAVLFLMYK